MELDHSWRDYTSHTVGLLLQRSWRHFRFFCTVCPLCVQVQLIEKDCESLLWWEIGLPVGLKALHCVLSRGRKRCSSSILPCFCVLLMLHKETIWYPSCQGEREGEGERVLTLTAVCALSVEAESVWVPPCCVLPLLYGANRQLISLSVFYLAGKVLRLPVKCWSLLAAFNNYVWVWGRGGEGSFTVQFQPALASQDFSLWNVKIREKRKIRYRQGSSLTYCMSEVFVQVVIHPNVSWSMVHHLGANHESNLIIDWSVCWSIDWFTDCLTHRLQAVV